FQFGSTHGGRRCSSCSQPDGNFSFHCSGINAKIMNRSTELSAPVDFFRPVDRQEKFQFFFKKFIIIVQVISKKRKTLNKGTPSGHDFGSSAGNEIYGCKLLIDPNGLFGT